MPLAIDRLLETMFRNHAPDAVLVVGRPPLLRVGARLRALQIDPLDADDVERLARGVDEAFRRQSRDRGLTEFSLAYHHGAHFDVTLLNNGSPVAIIRRTAGPAAN